MSEQHQNLIRTIESQRARIEALEAALRDIMMDVEIATPVREFARTALVGDQTTPTKQD